MTRLKHLFEEELGSQSERITDISSTIVADVQRFSRRAFSNGDIYVGNFRKILPDGKGKYEWKDGTVYEGGWEEGKMTGKGEMVWSSGAKYVGDFSGGYLHGFGTFTTPDGSVYRGTWRMNIRHGFGKKEYCNSDVYVGSWKEGIQEGSGRYSWNNGNIYIGNWKSGKMCGRGVMKWANGDVYDGFWSNGLRHGSGIYRYADGGYYFGTWTKGLKDGKGTFYPAGSKHPPLKKWCTSLEYDDSGASLLTQSTSLKLDHGEKKPSVMRSLSEKITVSGILRSSSHLSHTATSSDISSNLCDPAGELILHDSSCTISHTSDDGQSEVQDHGTVVYEREYMQGILIRERLRNYVEPSHRAKGSNKFHAKEAKKSLLIDIFKGNRSYYLMLNLQLGIRNLREMFKLDAAEYMMSICGDDGLRELSSPGKSGSIFYLSHDDKFVIKTLKRSELKVLLRMLPSYYKHVQQYENTLITKFFGVHRITVKSRRKVHFVVMGNMFCTELRIHRRYDLKGSSQGRFTDKDKIQENTTLKDLDLSYEFQMDRLLRESLFKQLSEDCDFLKSQHIIDYSLLLGLHFRAPEQMNGLLEPPNAMPNNDNLPSGASDQLPLGMTSEGELLIPPKGLLLVAHEPSFVNTTPGPHIRGRTLRAYSVGDKEVDLLLPGTGRLRVQLGVNMPAQANHKILQDEAESTEVELFEVYDVVLYMGIIDILQEYNVKKRVEHACKSVPYDRMSISVVDPKSYAQRFISFLQQKVFPERP